MKNFELLWKYIDGECSPEEEAQVERLLAEDLEFKREWARRVKLHRELQQQEVEQPSLRFARNVMDRLPELYRKLDISPLISPLWRKIIGGVAGAFLLAYFALVFNVIETAGPAKGGQIPEVQAFVDALTGLPAQAMSILLALSFGYILLAFLDRQLKKRFEGEARASGTK
ncbi:MAG: zf-HC2 domain-containing protein [Phaeodactylibacter sp.]|nr:zf-HC2 domain-containing protein [Phaeodactylibacter sp.]